MSEKPFRKASLERVNSPEQLNEYMRVARPGIWVTLSAVVLLLIGVVVWGVFGSVNTTVEAVAVVRGGETTLYIGADKAVQVETGMSVQIGENAGTIRALSDAPARMEELVDDPLLLSGYFTASDLCYTASIDAAELPEGVFAATIIVESVHPIRFVTH